MKRPEKEALKGLQAFHIFQMNPAGKSTNPLNLDLVK
jgi:hypothetical protein